MRLTRPFALRSSLALVSTAGLTSILALGGVFSCSKYPTLEYVPPDCTVTNGYGFESIDEFAKADGWFAAADYPTPDGGAAPTDPGYPDYMNAVAGTWTSTSTSVGTNVVASGGTSVNTGRMSMSMGTIPEGPVCGNTNAAVFRASHNNDWGGMFGKWNFGPKDGSPYEGISFWARAPGKTAKAFTLLLDDDNTTGPGYNCWVYSMNDGGVTQTQSDNSSNATDPGTGTPITGSSNSRASYKNECGNGFYVIVQLTSDWQFITLPFSQFKQTASPNRVPNAQFSDGGAFDGNLNLLTSSLRNFTLRMPKEAEMELWMAGLAFYGAKKPDAGGLTGEAGRPDVHVKPVEVDAPVKPVEIDAPAADTLDAADALDATNMFDADDAN